MLILAKIAAFLLKHWKAWVLLALIAGLYGWGYHSASKKAEDAAKIRELTQQRDTARQQARDSENSRKAADAARARNDIEIPKARRESAARVDRAATADDAQRLRDIKDALNGYGSAANQL